MLLNVYISDGLTIWLLISILVLLAVCILLIRVLSIVRKLLPHTSAQTKLLSMIAYKQGVPVDDIEFIMYDIQSLEKLKEKKEKQQ